MKPLVSSCTGCEACSFSCNFNAIYFSKNNNGYLYPSINKELCVNCGKCKNACAVYNNPKLSSPISCYLYQTNDLHVLSNSSSGGFAHDLALIALELGYDVYGVRYDKNLKKAVHDQITKSNINEFSKSKYTKALINDLYKKIHISLINNKNVMCIGLPCENYAVSQLFQKDRNNLVLVDLLCGGSLNDEYLTNYIDAIEQKKGQTLKEIDFRNKSFGSEILCTKATFTDNSYLYLNGSNNLYISMLGSNFVRTSCLNCKMGYLNSQSDYKIGDYFGANKREKGVSVVLCYSSCDAIQLLNSNLKLHGQFNECKEQLESIVVCRSKKGGMNNLEEIYQQQVNFYDKFKKNGLNKAISEYIIKKYTIKQKIYLNLPYFIKKVLKNG